MPGLKNSILRRMLFSHLAIVLIGLIVVGLVTAWLAKGYIYDAKRDQLVRQARQVNVALPNLAAAKDSGHLLQFLQQAYGAQIWVFDRTGRIIATSGEKEIFIGKSVAPTVLSEVLAGRDVIQSLRFEGLSEPMLSVVVPWGDGEQIQGGIILHSPIEMLNRTIALIRETLLWVTLAAMLISAAAGTFTSISIVRPLKRIERVAAGIGAGQYNRRVEHPAQDEIGELAATINTMAAKLAVVESERRALEQAREDLFANIAHDLRAPLTGILGFLEALLDGIAESRDEERRYLAVTYREALHLNQLVNDLLDLNRLAAGAITLRRVPVHLSEVAQEVCTEMEPAARKRGNALALLAAESLPPVAGDPVRLRQILINLVDNAIKFTQGGRITVTLQADAGGVIMAVSDTGAGIPAHDLPLIWERFHKGDPMRTRGRGGSGLGLAIVKELVKLHGGQAQVASQRGHGSTFRIWLPAWAEGGPERRGPSPPGAPGARPPLPR